MTTASKAKATKAPTRKTAKAANHCWPGYKPVAGKMSGEKGSCVKKSSPTKAEKGADAKAAAARKREKAA